MLILRVLTRQLHFRPMPYPDRVVDCGCGCSNPLRSIVLYSQYGSDPRQFTNG
jgi:hypothetical protein